MLARPAGALAIALLACGCARFEEKPAAAPPPPPQVAVVEVESRDVPLSAEWLGTVDGLVNATVRAKVQGYLMEQVYKDGGMVKKGDVLFEIDPRPFQAALDQAKGQLAQAEGALGQAVAALGKADIDVTRYTPLAAAKAISQQDLDNAIQFQLGARAAVDGAKASVDAAKAAVESAQLNLEFTTVRSPVDGVAAISTTQVGDLVGPGTGTLTTVSTIDPVRVIFPISEQQYLAAAEKLSGKPSDGVQAALQLILSDGSIFPHTGKVSAADNQVDTKTGTIKIVGVFPNPEKLLRQGQYARVRAVTKLMKDAIVIPARATMEVQGSFAVMVVDADDKAEIRQVVLGPQVSASEVTVLSGLEVGDTLVVEGFQKVRPGVHVTTKAWTPTDGAAKKSKKKPAAPKDDEPKPATPDEKHSNAQLLRHDNDAMEASGIAG